MPIAFAMRGPSTGSACHDMREESYDSLKDWFADRIDTWFFNQLAGNTAEARAKYLGFNAAIPPSATRVFRGGAVANDQSMNSSTQEFKLSLIDKAVNRAKTTGPIDRKSVV